MAKRIICTVTNDLTYDQRMQRTARSLVAAGYAVTLLGRELPASEPLDNEPFAQIRMRCKFNKGFLFYAEYNIRLFFALMRLPWDAVCTVDLDTMPGGCTAALLRGKKRVFDAHEYFTEVPEVVGRPFVRLFWSIVARIFIPFYHHACTVGPALADLFSRKYGIPFQVVRNVPRAFSETQVVDNQNIEKTILYQGALNEGRGIEFMLEAMAHLDGVQLWLAGEGDLSESLRARAEALGVTDRVRFWGFVKPEALKALTRQAWLGLNLLENRGLSYYYSLANKFFDCVQARVPVLTVDFPEYKALNEQHEVAVLLPDIQSDTIVHAVRRLMEDEIFYNRLKSNCAAASAAWVWEKDERVLLDLWGKALP